MSEPEDKRGLAAPRGAEVGPAVDDRPVRAPARRASVGVAAVCGMAGLLLATNASLFAADDDRHPENLVQLARAETERLEEVEAEVAALRTRVRDVVDAQPPAVPSDVIAGELTSHASGRNAVTGPGLVVEMWDAPPPPDFQERGLHVDDLVVHQQDLEAVINALWAGGAEAMTIQGQRIVSTSSVRCVGNVLLLHGRHYSPPYRVAAIGDPDALENALMDSPGVEIYLQYVEAVNLGWSVTERASIEMPAYEGSLRLEYATVPVAYAGADAGNDAGEP
ncbi:DUF881 domain-containing protein [Georgenia wangjunii]|uniref:DUF881 domain-containing protein n=1 Tax=Georgenia wangjunii TaxID=3117730 RepID=UPI002F262920